MSESTQLLLVEDSLEDIELTRLALEDAEIDTDLHVVRDGEQALRFLRRQGDYIGVPRPDIILLDLNMPRMNGREVLRQAKSDPELRRIPIIIFTNSGAKADIDGAYDLHANAYVRKPLAFDAVVEVAEKMSGFWLDVALLPPGPGTA